MRLLVDDSNAYVKNQTAWSTKSAIHQDQLLSYGFRWKKPCLWHMPLLSRPIYSHYMIDNSSSTDGTTGYNGLSVGVILFMRSHSTMNDINDHYQHNRMDVDPATQNASPVADVGYQN